MVADELHLLHVSDSWAMGEIDGCLAVVWRAQPTADAFRMRNEALLQIARDHPRGCALVELVEETSKAPSDETRRIAMEVFKELGATLHAIGFVLEGNQMKSALNRAILTTMMFFVKQLQPTKIFKHPVDAARWVKPFVSADDVAFESRLISSLERLRSVIGQKQPSS